MASRTRVTRNVFDGKKKKVTFLVRRDKWVSNDYVDFLARRKLNKLKVYDAGRVECEVYDSEFVEGKVVKIFFDETFFIASIVFIMLMAFTNLIFFQASITSFIIPVIIWFLINFLVYYLFYKGLK